MLNDTHCHLDIEKFDADRVDVLKRAERAGVTRFLLPGLDWQSSKKVVAMVKDDPRLYAAVGVHPTEAGTFQREQLEQFRQLAGNPKVVAIGEIGLDQYWETVPHELQKQVLQAQLVLAAELALPVIIHFREKGDAPDGPCAADLMEMLWVWVEDLRAANSPLAGRPGVLHAFSGSKSTAQRAMKMNFYLGVGGPVTYRKERQELVANLPLESLLLETDAPFLAPAPQRGKRNEPAFVALIADKIAALHQCNVEEVAAVTSANALRLFCWEQ